MRSITSSGDRASDTACSSSVSRSSAFVVVAELGHRCLSKQLELTLRLDGYPNSDRSTTTVFFHSSKIPERKHNRRKPSNLHGVLFESTRKGVAGDMLDGSLWRVCDKPRNYDRRHDVHGRPYYLLVQTGLGYLSRVHPKIRVIKNHSIYQMGGRVALFRCWRHQIHLITHPPSAWRSTTAHRNEHSRGPPPLHPADTHGTLLLLPPLSPSAWTGCTLRAGLCGPQLHRPCTPQCDQ